MEFEGRFADGLSIALKAANYQRVRRPSHGFEIRVTLDHQLIQSARQNLRVDAEDIERAVSAGVYKIVRRMLPAEQPYIGGSEDLPLEMNFDVRHASGALGTFCLLLPKSTSLLLGEKWSDEGLTRYLTNALQNVLLERNLLDNWGEADRPKGEAGRGVIDRKDADPIDSLEARLRQLVELARVRPNESADLLIGELFPHPSTLVLAKPVTEAPPLPKKPLAQWPRDKEGDENSVAFATRIYRIWMDAGVLTRQALKDIDPELFASVDNWLKHNRRKTDPSPLPKGFNLPSNRDVNDAWARRVLSGREPFPTDPGELLRLSSVVRYRDRAGQTK
ncbi:MAG: hypothetical protein WDM81_20950 [Rhizomicrobium sp.]